MPKAKSSDVFERAQAALAKVTETGAAREAVAADLDAKTAEWNAAKEYLATVQDELNELLGPLLPATDTRFRKSA